MDLLIINYATSRTKDFAEFDLSDWNYKEIIKFHEIRSDSNDMTKIEATGPWLRKVPFVSNLWIFMNDTYNIHMHNYIGPKEEESEMRNKITEFYVQKVIDVKISILEANYSDTSLHWDDEDDCSGDEGEDF